MAERLLILAVDIDNDLYRKTRINGPVMGRNNNLSAASKLALADPQDTDANVMFEAVKKYDELKKEYDVEIATITGAEKEGFVADREISRQIDLLTDRLKVDACVLVTDGASDTHVVPLLKSRLKVTAVDYVRMKQAPQLENTYFTILEKLREPHYARIVFGIPAILLLLFAMSYYFGLGWQLPVALIGIYLVVKGFGLEEYFIESFRGFGFSVDRLSFLFYVSAIIFFLLGLIIGYGNLITALLTTTNLLTVASYFIEGFLLLLTVSLISYLVGRMIDLENRSMHFKAINEGVYIGYSAVALGLVYVTASWIIGQIYFSQFLLISVIAVVLGYGISFMSSKLKARAIDRSKLKNKNVLNDIGAYIGKITSIDSRRGIMKVKTDYGSTINFDVDRITHVSDRVIVR